MEVGLLLGSFNPPHSGHFHIIDLCFKKIKIDEVWIIPSPMSPFKKKLNLVSYHTRFEMLNIILKEIKNNKIKLCDIEKKMPQPNYTYKTIDLLKDKYPSYHFHLILGEDNVNHFHKWKNYEKILKKINIIGFRRNKNPLLEKTFKFNLINENYRDISSTKTREKIKNQENINEEIPWEPLRVFIYKNKLFL